MYTFSVLFRRSEMHLNKYLENNMNTRHDGYEYMNKCIF